MSWYLKVSGSRDRVRAKVDSADIPNAIREGLDRLLSAFPQVDKTLILTTNGHIEASGSVAEATVSITLVDTA